jgi:hypothetical protein
MLTRKHCRRAALTAVAVPVLLTMFASVANAEEDPVRGHSSIAQHRGTIIGQQAVVGACTLPTANGPLASPVITATLDADQTVTFHGVTCPGLRIGVFTVHGPDVVENPQDLVCSAKADPVGLFSCTSLLPYKLGTVFGVMFSSQYVVTLTGPHGSAESPKRSPKSETLTIRAVKAANRPVKPSARGGKSGKSVKGETPSVRGVKSPVRELKPSAHAVKSAKSVKGETPSVRGLKSPARELKPSGKGETSSTTGTKPSATCTKSPATGTKSPATGTKSSASCAKSPAGIHGPETGFGGMAAIVALHRPA